MGLEQDGGDGASADSEYCEVRSDKTRQVIDSHGSIFFFNPKNSGKSLNVFSRNTFHDQIHIF